MSLRPPPAPPSLLPWEQRQEWHAAALTVAMVVTPRALQVVLDWTRRAQRPRVERREAVPLLHRPGRRPGVRPPRSC